LDCGFETIQGRGVCIGGHESGELLVRDLHQGRYFVLADSEGDRDREISVVVVVKTNGDGVKLWQLLYGNDSVHVEEDTTTRSKCRQ
jgi:hypothetical protein